MIDQCLHRQRSIPLCSVVHQHKKLVVRLPSFLGNYDWYYFSLSVLTGSRIKTSLSPVSPFKMLPENTQSRLLFLSHAGADTGPARTLKERIEATPVAMEAGLKVWFDKDDLQAGRDWQTQLEEAIEKRATAFAVYVGSRGLINWVEREVRLALSRAATSNGQFPFIPILAAQVETSTALPGFVRQFQGVCDVENRPDEFQKLLGAVLGRAGAGNLQLES